MSYDLRPVVLIGPPGAGKSTVGRALAAGLGRNFVDLDLEVERASGCALDAFFAADNEAGFRVYEHDALRRVLRPGRVPRVIATGAGCVVHALNRALLAPARCVHLDVSADVAAARLGQDRPRPKTPDAAAWTRVVAVRAPHYATLAAVRIDTSGRSVDAVVAAVRDALAATEGRYDLPAPGALPQSVHFGARDDLAARLAKPDVGAVLIDHNVARLHPDLAAGAMTLALDASGAHKNEATLARALDFITGVPRRQRVALVGGGALLDLGGLAAHLMHRGHETIAVPTTPLAAVDATLGGKVAVDHAAGRNTLGAFHPPHAVHVDESVFATLAFRQVRAAAAECLKHALLDPSTPADGSLAPTPSGVVDGVAVALASGSPPNPGQWRALITLNLRRKAAVVALDPEDRGLRHALNLGHTLAHALESDVPEARAMHGEAVAAGLLLALDLSVRRGGLDAGFASAWCDRLEPLAFRGAWPASERLIALMRRDKKRTGAGLPLVLLEAPGRARMCFDVDVALVDAALSPLRARLSPAVPA